MSRPNITLPIFTEEDWANSSNYLSKSRLVLMDFCEIKYRKQYIDKCLPYESSHASTIGTRYHEFMELFMAVAHKYPTDKWLSFIHPDFTAEERPMLEWTINLEIERYNDDPELWSPIAMEYQVVDYVDELRGIIDRMDILDESTINVIEYKTTQSINKSKLQLEFGFYDILLDSIEVLKPYKRVYTVINPRLRKVVSFNPSRKSTIQKRIDKIKNAIETNEFKPTCGVNVDTFEVEYATNFCTICSLEEIAMYNKLVNFRAY